MPAPHTLLIFHGSARETASAAATVFTDELRTNKGCRNFSVCFLRGVEPDLAGAIADAIAKGHKKLRLMPLFLLPGAHTTDDIPSIVASFRSENPEITFEICNCLVHNPSFIDFVADQIIRD